MEGAIMLFIGLALFALIGYALLPTMGNAAVASAGTNGTIPSNLSSAAIAMNNLGPMLFSVSILLAIITGAMSLYGIFSR